MARDIEEASSSSSSVPDSLHSLESSGVTIQNDEPTNRSCLSRKKKVMMAVFNVTLVAVILGVFLSKSKTNVRNVNQFDGSASAVTQSAESGFFEVVEDVDSSPANIEVQVVQGGEGETEEEVDTNEDSAPTKAEVTDLSVTVFNGPLSDFLSSRASPMNGSGTSCSPNEILTQLVLVTDGYPLETSWEITRVDGTVLAFGPPQGDKYDRMTSYNGELCLPVGANVLVMYDKGRDGLCCKYGEGRMTISAFGETLVEVKDQSKYRVEYPFVLADTGGNVEVDSMGTESTSMTETQSIDDDVGMTVTSTTEAAMGGADDYTGSYMDDTMGGADDYTGSYMDDTMGGADDATGSYMDDTMGGADDATGTYMDDTMGGTDNYDGGGGSDDAYMYTADDATGGADDSMGSTGNVNGGGSDDTYCVTIEVLTDSYGKSETAYSFSSKPKNASEDPVVYVSKAVGDLENNEKYTDTVCVPAGYYEFTLEDSFRGLCCSGGNGYYSVGIEGEEILYGGSYNDFQGETSVTHTVIVGDGLAVPNRGKEWLTAHNTRRQTFHEAEGKEYKPLVWSNTLAAGAEAWLEEIYAAGCKNVRESGLVEGENLSFRKVGRERNNEEPENILTRWVDLKKNKSYPDNDSLTQAMWRATRYVGCADGSKTIQNEGGQDQICYAHICRYARAGNCQMRKYTDWKEPTLEDRTPCGPACPEDGCH